MYFTTWAHFSIGANSELAACRASCDRRRPLEPTPPSRGFRVAPSEGTHERPRERIQRAWRSSAVLAEAGPEVFEAATEVPWYRCKMGWERHDGSGSWDPTFEELTCDLGVCVCWRRSCLSHSFLPLTNLLSRRGEQVRFCVSSLTMATRSRSRSTTPCSSCCSSWQQLSLRLKDPEPSEAR